jgi:putative Holliday junction resolvase
MARDVAAIVEMLAPYGEVEAFVVGLPLGLEGGETDQGDRVRHFARRLRADTGIPVRLHDERFSSVESERLLIEGGVRRSARKGVIDKLAAVLILQAHLDGSPSMPLEDPA